MQFSPQVVHRSNSLQPVTRQKSQKTFRSDNGDVTTEDESLRLIRLRCISFVWVCWLNQWNLSDLSMTAYLEILWAQVPQVLGVDFSQAFIDAAERMRKGEATKEWRLALPRLSENASGRNIIDTQMN